MKKLTKFTFLKKLLAIFVSVALIVSAVKAYEITHPSTAFAVGDLTVNWGVPVGNTIFTVTDMAPGEFETHTVNVVNNGSSSRPVGVRGVETSPPGNLPTVLDLVISDDVNPNLYTGTLAQFFIDSAGPDGIHLFDLSPSQVKTITFKVTFNSSAGNQYQAKSVVFDIKIGISITVPDECSQIEFTGDPIFGTENRDVLHGTNGNDLIFAFEGNDVVNSSNGDDCIIGGPGDDILHGSNGRDIILGEDGNDRIDGSNGNDVLIGGDGNDRIDGSNGDDQINGGEGNDKILASNGNDQIIGGLGNDNIDANNGNDNVIGGPGNDKIDAGNGVDYVEGNEGNDDMKGRNGNDTLLGGADIDKADGGLGTDTCDAEAENTCEL